MALMALTTGVVRDAGAQPFAYVVVHKYTDGITAPTDGPQHLVVIDTATRTRVGNRILLEAGCASSSATKGIVASPDGARLFVVNCGSRSVSVVDTTSRTVVGRVALGPPPPPSPTIPSPSLAMSPDGTRLYVLRGSDILVIDPRSLAQLGALPTRTTSTYVPDIVVSPDGGQLFLADAINNRVLILGALTGNLAGTIATPLGFVSMALSRDGSTLYGSRNDQYLHVVDTFTRTQVGAIPLGLSRHAWVTPDDTEVWVPQVNTCGVGPTTTSIVQRSTHTVVGGIGTGCDPKGLAFTPDGSLALMSVFENVEIQDTATRQRLLKIYIEDIAEGRTNAVLIPPPPPSPPDPPTNLVVKAINGLDVTLRWNSPSSGPVPTSYVMDGGIAPGETLATIPTGSANPVFTFTAPPGSFHVRMRALNGTLASGPSNEVPLLLTASAPPSAPADLTGLANGASLWLTWRNTFTGGKPDSLLLDVTGSGAATASLPLSEDFAFSGVPAGTYTFRVRATNPAGSSTASNPVTLSFPGPCTGVPAVPANFIATRSGHTVFLAWDPAPNGAATSGFVLNVTGAFTASFPTAARTITATVGPGSYGLSVAGTNACGQSAATPVQTVTVP